MKLDISESSIPQIYRYTMYVANPIKVSRFQQLERKDRCVLRLEELVPATIPEPLKAPHIRLARSFFGTLPGGRTRKLLENGKLSENATITSGYATLGFD